MATHINFVSKIATYIFERKVITIDDYMETICDLGQPLDEIGIVLIARMYHVHVAVMQNKYYWTTRKDHDVQVCTILLGWKGNLQFIDIKWKEMQELPVYNLCNAKYPPPNIETPSSPACGNTGDTGGAGSATNSPAHFRLPSPSPTRRYNLGSAGDASPQADPNKPQPDGKDPGNEDKPKYVGKLQLKNVGLKRTNRRKKSIKCGLCKKFTFVSQKDMNSHLKQHHPHFHFKCAHCDNQYKTYNGWYKHERKHQGKCHICEMCTKSFMYPQGLRLHVLTHTKVRLIPCTNCPCKLTDNRNMLAHAATHHSQEFTCDICSKKFNMKPNLDQHKRGCHSDGWVTPCGQSVDWPHKLSKHKQVCKKCKQIKARKEKNAAILALQLSM